MISDGYGGHNNEPLRVLHQEHDDEYGGEGSEDRIGGRYCHAEHNMGDNVSGARVIEVFEVTSEFANVIVELSDIVVVNLYWHLIVPRRVCDRGRVA